MNQPNAIFFDFDGVIADSLMIALEVNQMSKPTLTLERYINYFDGNINDAYHEDKVFNHINFFEEYGKRFQTLDLNSDKKHVIEKLAKNFKLFIISSTISSIISNYLERHGILSCFTEIYGNERSGSKVEKFEMIFKKYELEPKNVIFITDTLGDIKEAKKVNIKTIVGIRGGFQDEERLLRGEPNTIVSDFPEFYDFVEKSIYT